MASTKLRHLYGGSLGILDDIAKLDMPDYPMKEVPFGEEGEGVAPPTPVGPIGKRKYRGQKRGGKQHKRRLNGSLLWNPPLLRSIAETTLNDEETK